MSKDIDNRFDYHPPTTTEKKNKHSSIRMDAKALAEKLEAEVPPGREQALAITKIEEAMFWANAGIARNN